MSLSCPSPSIGGSPQPLYRPHFRPFTYRRPRPNSGPLAEPATSDAHAGRQLPLTPPVWRSRPRLSWRMRTRQNFERDWTRRWGERWSDVEQDGSDASSSTDQDTSICASVRVEHTRSVDMDEARGSADENSGEQEPRVCGICLEVPQETFWCPHCLHPWCNPCIRRWSRTSPNSSCPNCRSPLELRNYDVAHVTPREDEYRGQYTRNEDPGEGSSARFDPCEIHREELVYFDLRQSRHVCATCVLQQRQAPSGTDDTMDSTTVNYFSQPYMPQLYMGNTLPYNGVSSAVYAPE